MKKEKSPSVPQMTLFETEPGQPAVVAKPDKLPLTQPEPVPTAQPTPPPPVEKKRAAPVRGSKPKTQPELNGAARKSPQQAAPRADKRSGSSAVPEGDVRLTANIREDLHLRLKIAAVRQRTTIGELIEQWVENNW